MSKEQHSKKYIEIPGEKMVIHNFHFDMTLPSPAPHPKTLYLPLDPERYIKPKTTLFHVKRKAAIMTDVNLSIPVEELNMHPENYNSSANGKVEIPADIHELIDEVVPKIVKKITPVPEKKKLDQDTQLSLVKTPSLSKGDSKAEAANANKNKEEKLSLEEHINKTFETIKTVSVGMKHPKKANVTCQSVFTLLPNIKDLGSEFYVLKTEVGTSLAKDSTKLLKFIEDQDKKPLLSLSVQKSLFEGSEKDSEEVEKRKNMSKDKSFDNVVNFEHYGNYIYNMVKKNESKKKELVVNLHRSEKIASIYHPHTITLKRKNVTHKKREDEDDDEDEDREKNVAEEPSSIRILKKGYNKKEIINRKKKFEELRIIDHEEYKNIQKKLEKESDDEEENEYEKVKKRLVEADDEIKQMEQESKAKKDEEAKMKNKEDDENDLNDELNELFQDEEEEN